MDFEKLGTKKNYLCRIHHSVYGPTYLFAQGYEVGNGIAIVRPQVAGKDAFTFEDWWTAIDIESGLGIGCPSFKTFKACLERINSRKDLLDRLISARSLKSYKDRKEELLNEKYIWRQSGYVL